MTATPVVTIDGPSGAGKGTLGRQLAAYFGWHYLDSGAVYRALALYAQSGRHSESTPKSTDAGCAATKILAECALKLPLRFQVSTQDNSPAKVWLDDVEVTDAIRAEAISQAAADVAVIPEVRVALLALQRRFRRLPGLIADGRDMGTVVFPSANLKIFLDADLEIRAQRRAQQLNKNQVCVSMPVLIQLMRSRDEQDGTRKIAPLQPARDAMIVDSTYLGITEVFTQVADAILAAKLGATIQ